MARQLESNAGRRHTQYFTKDGTLVPGITTITGMLDKPALPVAANRLGLEGIDSGEYWKDLATVGKCAHLMIEYQIKGKNPSEALRDFTPNQTARAGHSLAKFNLWISKHDFKFVASEFQLVSEKYRYGGTGDCLAYVDGKLTYIDFKTGGIYRESELQGAANAENIMENGFGPGSVEQFILLGLPRNEEEKSEERTIAREDWGNHFQAFLALLDAYRYLRLIDSVKQVRMRTAPQLADAAK